MTTLEESAARIAFHGITVAAEAALAVFQMSEQARPAALYLLVTGGNVPGALAARVYGCSKQYVSKALREVEDRREDPAFDAALSALERRLFQVQE